MFVRCNFCHKLVFRWFYKRHERKHTRRREDGQMAEHATAPPAQRFSGSLDDVPQAYAHSKCGVVTKMPEEIIRSYLVNPLMYTDSSFCCGCGRYVFSAELIWQETGERVIDYTARLRAEYLERTYRDFQLDKQQVFVTPRAAQAFHKVARDQGISGPYYLAIERPDDESEGTYKLDLAPRWNPDSEARFDSAGVQVLLRREQLDTIGSLVVDYPEGAEAGFTIGRISS
jgi:hypothetical protein